MISYSTQINLMDRKLAIAKSSADGELTLFKYHRRVMYDYLWFEQPELRECRGHVYENMTGALVQAAPRKTFNYGENGWWSTVPLETDVKLYKKYNGFMACSTAYNGKRLITTTGSFDSEYQKIAYQEIDKLGAMYSYNFTDLFEIIADFDPHIVDEGPQRAVYLGSRDKRDGAFLNAHSTFAFEGKLRDALQFAMNDRGEGFMMYAWNDFDCSNGAKLKTPYYAGKKQLMRANETKVREMYKYPDTFAVPDIYRHTVQEIVKSVSILDWLSYDDQTRRKYIEQSIG